MRKTFPNRPVVPVPMLHASDLANPNIFKYAIWRINPLVLNTRSNIDPDLAQTFLFLDVIRNEKPAKLAQLDTYHNAWHQPAFEGSNIFGACPVVSSSCAWVTGKESLNRDLGQVSEWCDFGGMKLNTSMINTMIASRSRTMRDPELIAPCHPH